MVDCRSTTEEDEDVGIESVPGARLVSEAIGVALIGFGYWGPNYARVLCDLPGLRLTVICDRDADRLASVRLRYPGVATCTDMDEVLARAETTRARFDQTSLPQGTWGLRRFTAWPRPHPAPAP